MLILYNSDQMILERCNCFTWAHVTLNRLYLMARFSKYDTLPPFELTNSVQDLNH